MPIDYNGILPPGAPMDYTSAAARLIDALPDLWVGEYYDSCQHEPNILQISIEDCEHLFDFTSDPAASLSLSEVPEDRLVAVFGLSKQPAAARDASRMRGFLGGRLTSDSGPQDKGHFIAHSAGGGLDINLFPQRPELNRGHSKEGKAFRQMERYAASNPGTFVFARPIYGDSSWSPASLEYGVLMDDLCLWVERFSN